MEIEPECEYDVFLSFRGPDTRLTFVDCLYRSMKGAGIHVFRDNEELRVGEQISGALLKALNKSQIYIPIFSLNFASSSWCLREVAHMVELTSKSNGKKEILPIFYDVETDDVKLKTRLYRKAIRKHKKKFGSDELKRWKGALVEVPSTKGWDLKGKGIIITTRDKSILMTQVDSSSNEALDQRKRISAYEVHEMQFDRALQLFYKHAFRSDSPVEDYLSLSTSIVRKVAGLPLALEVIGSFLFCNGFALEQHLDKRKLWEDTLKQLHEAPFKDVRDALMISYEQLETKQKEIFLDIACFFTNEVKTYPIIMWDDCNYHPLYAIAVLCQRSLIKIDNNDKFWMHDQVRDLGRHIIREQYPHRFSRVWIHEDAIKLLKRKEPVTGA